MHFDRVITSLCEFNASRSQNTRANIDSSAETQDNDESDELTLLELISDELLDDEDSDSDSDYNEDSSIRHNGHPHPHPHLHLQHRRTVLHE